jgi:hypothetical protein
VFCCLLQDCGSSFAVCNGVLLGALLELLVVRGGLQGTLEAVSIVDSCHGRGECFAGMPQRATAAPPWPATLPAMTTLPAWQAVLTTAS